MQIYVPVTADGFVVRDNGGDVIANCASPVVAAAIADLINRDASGPISRQIHEAFRFFA